MERQAQWIGANQVEHGATTAYRLRDVLIADATIYAQGRFEAIGARKRRPFLIGACDELNEAQLCADTGSEQYFGHWLVDSLAKEMLATERGLTPLNFVRPARVHEHGYRRLLEMNAVVPALMRVRDLWIVDDRGYNADHVRRVRLMRERVRARAVPSGHERIFLARGNSGVARALLNDEDIMETLVERGFIAIYPEDMEPAAIAAALAGARIVAAVEGSVLAHAHLALPAGAAMLVIEPPRRFNAQHKVIGEFWGLRFGYTVADDRPGGFWLAPERLLRTLDLVEAAI